MNLKTEICMAGPEDAGAWNRYVLNHPSGLGYHLYGWGLAVQEAYGFEPVYLMARSGCRIQGVLPLVKMGLPLGKTKLVSLPYCDAAGILASCKQTENALLAAALAYLKDVGGSELHLRAARPFPGIEAGKTMTPGKVRMLLPLPDTEEALAALLKAKVRSQAKKPEKDGLTFELGGTDLVPQFYGVFRENMRDLGSPVHSTGFIRQVMENFAGRAHIGLVRMPDKSPAAAGIILNHRSTVSIPWASSLRRCNALNPNMLLYWHLLRFSVRLGVKQFDFGRSTPGEGTFRFKKQWGAMPSALHWGTFDRTGQLRHGSAAADGGAGRFRPAAERVISRMPLSLMTWAGSRVRRYISL